MHVRHLLITLTIGFGLLLLLYGSVYNAPRLQAAGSVIVEQRSASQAADPQGVLAQLVVTPTQDNTLYESATGDISNGAGDYFFVGTTARGASIRRGLLFFDLSGKLPVSATIVSATLQLHMSKTSSGQSDVALHRLLKVWGQGTSNANSNEGGGATATTGDATWLHTLFNTTLWQTAGGDFVPTTTATLPVVGINFYRWSSPGLVADIERWLANPASNFGWVLVGNETESGTAKRFDTRENPIAANRPQLMIVYNTGTAEQQSLYLPLIRQ